MSWVGCKDQLASEMLKKKKKKKKEVSSQGKRRDAIGSSESKTALSVCSWASSHEIHVFMGSGVCSCRVSFVVDGESRCTSAYCAPFFIMNTNPYGGKSLDGG